MANWLRLTAASVLLAAVAAAGQETDVPEQVSESSELTLDMRGAVTARVNIVVSETGSGLIVEKDGETHRFDIPKEECLSLWDYCLTRNAMSLEDAVARRRVPDQSHFELMFRIASDVHRFTIDGVDDLDDPRYREIVRAILSLAQRYYPELEQ